MFAVDQDIATKAVAFGIPPHMAEAIDRYVNDGVPPGGFLSAVIQNDLTRAVGRADGENIGKLPDYVRLFYNHAPAGCWGSVEAYDRWTKKGGLRGLS